MIKVLKKLGTEEKVAQHDKGCIFQTYSQHHTKWVITEIISSSQE
jgi:hypothetical protein